MLHRVKSESSNSRIAISPARAAAFDILLRVEREESYASELLHSRVYDRMSAIDHSLTTEVVMGVLRWRSVLDKEISELSSQPLSKLDLEVLTTLRMGCYQLRYLDRIPARAAINESVELVKRARKHSAAPFVNAILRKLASRASAREVSPEIELAASTAIPLSGESIAVNFAHPLWMVERWRKAYGIESVLKICRYDQSIPSTAIRLRDPAAEEHLRAEGIELTAGSILRSARKVVRGDVRKTGAFAAGLCVIQDEASQLVAALVGQGTSVLDCCAAPGGKALAIGDRNLHSQIAAVELHPHRARLLKKILSFRNPSRDSGPSRIRLITGDARSLPLSANFDRVLADVPCSGTGTLSRNPEIKWRLIPEDFVDLQARQLAILRSAMEHVASGGRLIYSTCSLEREENEDVIEGAMAENRSFRILDCGAELDRLRQEGELVWPDQHSLSRGPFLRTLPGVHPCDGFFVAIVEKA
jgi:16S rRNA (cytosine967-C5)-methyltransferase